MIRPGLFTVGWQLHSVQICCFITHGVYLFLQHFTCGDKVTKTLAVVQHYLLNYECLCFVLSRVLRIDEFQLPCSFKRKKITTCNRLLWDWSIIWPQICPIILNYSILAFVHCHLQPSSPWPVCQHLKVSRRHILKVSEAGARDRHSCPLLF